MAKQRFSPLIYCQQMAQKSGSNFYLSFNLLPIDKRNAMTALYAYCRALDDVVDTTRDENIALAKLMFWKTEITQTFDLNEPQHPITRCLLPYIKQFNLPKAPFVDLIAGMQMDIHKKSYANFAELRHYCYHAASVVGLLTAKVLAYTSPQTQQYAEKLGIALQLINIIRDIKEDHHRGRCYLPQDEMEAYKVYHNDFSKTQPTPELVSLLKFQAKRARQYFFNALTLLPKIDAKSQYPGVLMANTYMHLLYKMEKNNFQHILVKRTRLSHLQKLWVSIKTMHQLKKHYAKA